MKGWKSAVLGLLGLGLMAVAGGAALAQTPGPSTTTTTTAATLPKQTPATPGVGTAMAEYRLDSGDKLKITVFGEPDLSGNFEVDGQGVISMSLIGEVSAKGLTIRELQRVIETKLKDGFVREPQVAAEVQNYRPYYILGEIAKAGEYPYTAGLSVMNAIASAGDFTYRADKRRVFIKSVDSPKEREVKLTPSLLVKPGDTIRIKERFF